MKHLAAWVLIGLAVPSALPGSVIRVPGEQPTIQAGMTAATAGDTVLVACGTYHERCIPIKSGVCLTSETGSPDCVTVDGDSLGRVLICDGVGDGTTIEGITVTGGYAHGYWYQCMGAGIYCVNGAAPVIRRCVIRNNWAGCSGGGIYCGGASPTILDCTIEGNTSQSRAGGLGCEAGAAPVLERVVFRENTGVAGAAWCEDSSPSFSECEFLDNVASYNGALYEANCSGTLEDVVFQGNSSGACGGAMRLAASSPIVSRAVFEDNSARYGGAIWCTNASSPMVVDAIFSGNHAKIGGALYFELDCSATFKRVVFADNVATTAGGVVQAQVGAHPVLERATLVGNSSPDGSGIHTTDDSVVTLTNCIVAFGQQGTAIVCVRTGIAVAECCDIYGNAGGDWVGCMASQYGSNGNFSSDPLFCDSAGGDFGLAEASPCAADNSPCSVTVGMSDVGCNATPVRCSSWGVIKSMFR